MHLRRLGLPLAASFFLLASAAFSADGSVSFTAERMWSLQRLGSPSISRDGKWAVVSVSRYDIGEDKGYADLWLVPVAGGPARQLTSDKAADSAPVFSPDGGQVAFVSKRGDDTESQIYVIDLAGGEARRVSNIPTGADTPKWFANGKRIAFVSKIWLDLAQWPDQAKRLKERAESKMSARVWNQAPISYWDHWLDEREPHIFSIAVNVAADATNEPVAITRLSGYSLSRSEYSDSSYAISADGEEIALVANVDRSGIDPNYDVLVLAACGCKRARNLTANNPADDNSVSYSPDGRWLAITQQKIKGFYADRERLSLLERKSGAIRELTTNWDRAAAGLVWLPDSSGLLGAVDDAATTRVFQFDLTGSTPRAVTAAASFSGLSVAPGNNPRQPRIVAIRQSFSEPPTLVSLDLAKGSARQLSTFNDSTLAATKLGKVESVNYAGARGDAIQMWVVYPPDFDPNKKYPLYMLLHGGPHSAIIDHMTFRWNAQVFASWGYIVTWHNFHGSSSFGNEFADSINPDRISMPYWKLRRSKRWREVMSSQLAGVTETRLTMSDAVSRRPDAAGKEPFKALIAHAAVYNNFTQIAADYGAEKERFFDYWDKPEEFARYSPHTNAGNFTTPTLVIHGQLDRRVPVNHGIELFNILQKRGVPSRLLYYPDENHWILKPQNSLFWYQTTRDWLATYAPPGAR